MTLPARSSLTNGMKPNAPEVISWPLSPPEALPETRGSGHIHWGVLAYHHLEDGQFTDSCLIEVEADNEQQAIARAQQILTRANYRISWVRETCTKDAALKESTS